MIFIFLCLTILFSILPSRSILVVTNGNTLSFLVTEWYSIVCVCIHVYIIIYIHSSVDGHLGSFYILTIVNNVAMNIEARTYF